mmetsp:Transcript_34167/g.38888  ORF Transcript_34167/g.38888 Transcript_34167/m.38888 type:complete len:124 (+) Transcript_34167:93-464(+)
MAKGLRSKIKRKHRSEFRRTIGTVAHNKAAAIVQEKLKNIVNKGVLKSFDRIADMLDTDGDMVDEVVKEPAIATTKAKEYKGENKIHTAKGRRKRKHTIKGTGKPKFVENKKERRKPKFFCKF